MSPVFARNNIKLVIVKYMLR